MPKPRKHVFVCRNFRDVETGKHSCEARGAEQVFEAFKKLRAERGIAKEVKLTKVKCFGKCKYGPNAVVYPDNIWYCGLSGEDIPKIVEDHLINGKPVEDKQLPDELI